jgi:hypothetical protein
MDSLEKMTIERLNNLEEKAFAQIEVMHGSMGINSVSKPDLYFDAECFNKYKFILTNGNKTVTLNAKENRYATFAQAPLPFSKKQEFPIRVDISIDDIHIMVGITPGNNRYSSDCYSSSGSYLFYCLLSQWRFL